MFFVSFVVDRYFFVSSVVELVFLASFVVASANATGMGAIMKAAPTRQPVRNPFGWRERLARLQGSAVQFDLRAYDQPLNIINSLESELLGLSSEQFAERVREIRDHAFSRMSRTNGYALLSSRWSVKHRAVPSA